MHVCEREEHGVGARVNDTMLSETLQVIRLTESGGREFRLRKKPMNLCACENEERENGMCRRVECFTNCTVQYLFGVCRSDTADCKKHDLRKTSRGLTFVSEN